MEARYARAALLAAALLSTGAQFRTPNFVVEAPTPELASQVGRMAEKYRRELAVLWLGKTMRNWSQPCPIEVRVGKHLGAGGVTSFLFDRGEVYGWRMNIQGPQDRLLDSVLPHEVTHTVFASYFRQPLPRWADEGACTTVEHASEKAKQRKMLIQFLKTGRGIPFSSMFAMKEYPGDVMPLYSQGFSLATFLIQQGGRHKFLGYVKDGLADERWTEVTKQHYSYPSLAALQDAWLDWVRQGSPVLDQPSADSETSQEVAEAPRKRRPQPNLIYRGQSEDPPETAGNLVPVRGSGGATEKVETVDGAVTRGRAERGPAASSAGPGATSEETKPAQGGLAVGWQVAAPCATANRSGSTARKPAASVPAADSSAAEDGVAEEPPDTETTLEHDSTRTRRPRHILLEWSRAVEDKAAAEEEAETLPGAPHPASYELSGATSGMLR